MGKVQVKNILDNLKGKERNFELQTVEESL